MDYLAYLRAEEGLQSGEGLLHSKETGTGVALITVDKTGRNTIILQPGANLELHPHEVTSFIASQAKCSNVLVCQNEISHGATLQALAEVSRIDHMVSIFNPAPISADLDHMFELLRYADVICPNEVELAMLAKMPVTNQAEAVLAGRHVLEKCRNLRKLVHFMSRERTASFASTDTVEEFVHIPEEDTGAVARRPQVMVVTLGSLGACIVSDTGSEMIPAPKVKSIDTVGAGDCFIGEWNFKKIKHVYNISYDAVVMRNVFATVHLI
jgi:ribokinase